MGHGAERVGDDAAADLPELNGVLPGRELNAKGAADESREREDGEGWPSAGVRPRTPSGYEGAYQRGPSLSTNPVPCGTILTHATPEGVKSPAHTNVHR